MAQAQRSSAGNNLLGVQLGILGCVIVLTFLGVVMIYSAGSVEAISLGEDPAKYLRNQLIFIVGAGVALAFAWLIPYNKWNNPVAVLAISAVVWAALIYVAVSGTSILGAQRWIYFGSFSIQPSEFAKIAFVLVTAYLLYAAKTETTPLRYIILIALGCVLVPLGFLFYSQSDLGTTAICAVGILAALWIGGVPWPVFVVVIFLGIGFLAYAIFGTSYRSDRLVFLDPWDDGENGQGSGFQLIHSFYAFAQGGLFGVGLGNSKEKFQYLPEAETDFIYSVIGEELGLLGAFFVLALFVVILWLSLKVVQACPDPFGKMLAGGCAAMLVFQAFLNIMCVAGLAPTTGKPLPFLSAGGSSLISSYIIVGLILSVAKGSVVPDVYHERRQNLRVVSHGTPSEPREPRRSRFSRSESAISRGASDRSSRTSFTETRGYNPSSRPSRAGSAAYGSSRVGFSGPSGYRAYRYDAQDAGFSRYGSSARGPSSYRTSEYGGGSRYAPSGRREPRNRGY